MSSQTASDDVLEAETLMRLAEAATGMPGYGVSPAFLAEYQRLKAQAHEAGKREGYTTGYNTGWQKANRNNDGKRFTKAATQLRLMADQFDQFTTTKPPEAICEVKDCSNITKSGTNGLCGEHFEEFKVWHKKQLKPPEAK